MTLCVISILMPFRNAAATLTDTLNSLSVQSFYKRGGELECVFINDGSTDASEAIIHQWTVYPLNRRIKLKILNTPGVGIARALNLGLTQCTGTWVARLDADDRCHPERLQSQLEHAQEHPELSLIGCNVKHWVETPENLSETAGMARYIDWTNTLLTHQEMALALWVDSPLPHPSWFVRREAFVKVGDYCEDRSYPEDYEWLHRFFLLAQTDPMLRAGKANGEPLLDWREREDRLTRQDSAYSEEAFMRTKIHFLKRDPRVANKTLFLFGLGPKGKLFMKLLNAQKTSLELKAIVDVHPRRTGIVYENLPVQDAREWSQWKQELNDASSVFVLNCLGTAEARKNSEDFCRENGLAAGTHFLSL